MPYNARVFQILIASPGDVEQEREVVTEIIHEWNNLNAREKSLVLLPLRWETHSSPELGTRPQAVINRQVVDQCDMVVGVFWTRLGTPTGQAASGTVEEIERTGKAGKIIMLYFSNAKADLETLDLDEYKRLREFKLRTYPEGLIESYSSLTEFRDKFSKQLAMKIRDLVAHDPREVPGESTDMSTPLTLAVAWGTPPQILRADERVEVERIVCTNEEEIPDYRFEQVSQAPSDHSVVIISSSENKHYYRQLVQYYIQQKQYRPFRLAIGNPGDVGIHDLYIEVLLRNSDGSLMLNQREELLAKPSTTTGSFVVYGHVFSDPAALRISKGQDNWEMQMELPVVQARRTVLSGNEFFLGAAKTSKVQLEATVYSSDSKPFTLKIIFELEVLQRLMSYQEIIKVLGEKLPNNGVGKDSESTSG